MAFIKTLKRALGFSDSEMEEEELEGLDARVVPLRLRNDDEHTLANVSSAYERVNGTHSHNGADAATNNRAKAVPNGNHSIANDAATSEHRVPDAIFETVVKIFNDSLPDFIKQSVNEQAQREYIYKALDDSMKHYLTGLANEVEVGCRQNWESDRQSLQLQLDDMRKQLAKEGEECEESKKMQLSAERQKRALSERVHDLEKQVATLEADNEQYQLENKSLANKIRLNTVVNNTDGAQPTSATTDELQAQVDDANAKLAQANDDVAKLKAELAEQKAEVEHLHQALDQSRAKDDVSDAMLTELTQKAAAANELAELCEKEVESKNNEIKELSANRESLQAAIKELEAERNSIKTKLDEAMENLDVIEQMNQQLTALEEARRSNESYLRKQKDELMRQKEELQRLQAEKKAYNDTLQKKDEAIHVLEDMTDSLRKTIENNLYEHAQSESALRSEIDRLKSKAATSATDTDKGQPAPDSANGEQSLDNNVNLTADNVNTNGKTAKVRISAIDDSLEDTDWLIATPPPAKAGATQANEDSDFGYKEPGHKASLNNPAQMSLW